MLAARITLLHLSASVAMNRPKSAGEPASGAAPKSASRALMSGSARAALISLLSLSMISGAVFFGAAIPNQLLEPISKSPEEDNEASELYEAEEVVGVVFPTDEDAALPLNPSKEALHEPTSHIAA